MCFGGPERSEPPQFHAAPMTCPTPTSSAVVTTSDELHRKRRRTTGPGEVRGVQAEFHELLEGWVVVDGGQSREGVARPVAPDANHERRSTHL